MSSAEVFWINGPVLKARPEGHFHMKEAVHVGPARLAAEVIRLDSDSITVQVFEDTTGLRPGVMIEGSGSPLGVELGPGMLGRMFDGIQRPLETIAARHGDFVRAGATVPNLDRDQRWPFRPLLEVGSQVTAGQVLGEVQETPGLCNRVLVPDGMDGRIEWLAPAGQYRVVDPVARVLCEGQSCEISLLTRWPIRTPRRFQQRQMPDQPLLTGQRVIDTLFPIGKGGAASMPGGFGTGKTVLQQTLAKWCDADLIIYIGCGERGNEMAEVLEEFPQLEDPRTGRRLMERTVLIANTSDMPVAAREASIYTGITIGEYFRDQGYDVALFADSISRWAEALREISGRLEELPAEEGHPAYLPSRLAEFFERAGHITTLAGASASLTVVGTVSPPGGDFSEPVTAHSRRYVKCFLALDRVRAQARFYPAIHPLLSYSEYVQDTARWWQQHGGVRWAERRERILRLIQEQARLEKMVKIVGRDALPASQRLILICAEVMVESLLRQSAFSSLDRYCSPAKQSAMLGLVDDFIRHAEQTVAKGADPDLLPTLPVVRRLQRMGDDIPNEQLELFDELARELDHVFDKLAADHDTTRQPAALE
ncbi:MAG: V-type ATP synthase subunit A [Gammaproteobacteria bacterium]|nr:V-type ATP synthase subunit A [Gammaproteobacteria bacterium]